MLAVNVMRIREAAPEPLNQETAADGDDAYATASTKVLGLVRATTHASSRETALGLRDNDAMAPLTPRERRRKALRVGYAACLLPG